MEVGMPSNQKEDENAFPTSTTNVSIIQNHQSQEDNDNFPVEAGTELVNIDFNDNRDSASTRTSKQSGQQRTPPAQDSAPPTSVPFSHYTPPQQQPIPHYSYEYFYPPPPPLGRGFPIQTHNSNSNAVGFGAHAAAAGAQQPYGYHHHAYPLIPQQWAYFSSSAHPQYFNNSNWPPNLEDTTTSDDGGEMNPDNDDKRVQITPQHDQIFQPGPPIQMVPDGHGPDGCNLFIFHIPNEMTNLDLFNFFSPFGNVVSARIMVDNDTGRSRGFGFVSFDTQESASNAIAHMNGLQVGTKRLKVQYKKDKVNIDTPGYGPDKPRSRGKHATSRNKQNPQRKNASAHEKKGTLGAQQASVVPQNAGCESTSGIELEAATDALRDISLSNLASKSKC